MTEPLCGDFDGIASRYNEHEAWVLHTDHWVEINRISHGNAVRRISQALFDQFFPDVPPLPSTAFRRGETVTMRAELAKEHVDIDKVARDEELNLHSERVPLADPGGDHSSEAARFAHRSW